MIFRSPYSDVSIPDMPLTAFVLRRAEELADKPALIDGPSGRVMTYRQLARAVRRAACGLAQRGFAKGDVFAIFSRNLPEYAIAFYAVARLGGITTTINPLCTTDELAGQLNDARAKYLFALPELMEKAMPAVTRSSVEQVFVLGQCAGTTPFASLLESDAEVPDVQINPREDIAALPYSSGTTGPPKGVMLTHYNLVANLRQTEAASSISETDTLIAVLPFFHIYGLEVLLNFGLYKGATVVTMPRFDLEQFLQLLQKEKVTYAMVVPPIILALAKHPLVDKYERPALRVINSGAAPLSDNVSRACAERVGCLVKQGYGRTETSPVTHTDFDDPRRARIGSVGHLLPNTECKVVDLVTGAALGPNQRGEIWIRGPQVMKGYLHHPEATAATIDDEGWLRTGDVGYADADGYFYIVDRVKEMIKYKGFQVSPAQLEAVLLSHPAITDAAVVPSPDEEAGEVPKAFVVLRSAVSAEQIMAFIADRAAPHKKIRASRSSSRSLGRHQERSCGGS